VLLPSVMILGELELWTRFSCVTWLKGPVRLLHQLASEAEGSSRALSELDMGRTVGLDKGSITTV